MNLILILLKFYGFGFPHHVYSGTCKNLPEQKRKLCLIPDLINHAKSECIEIKMDNNYVKINKSLSTYIKLETLICSFFQNLAKWKSPYQRLLTDQYVASSAPSNSYLDYI